MTQNLADFPGEALEPSGIDVQHPDEFLVNHLHLAPGLFCASVHKVRARLRNPPYAVEANLDTLTQLGLVATVAELGGFADLPGSPSSFAARLFRGWRHTECPLV